jgi:hypothetical protein
MNSEVNFETDYGFVTPAHCRAARAWLGWNLDVAEEKTGLARDSISRFERGARLFSLKTREKLVRKFAEHGILLERDGLRVRALS